MASEISQMSDSSIVIIQGTVGLYTVATRCHTCFAVTLKYTEDSSLIILRHSLIVTRYTVVLDFSNFRENRGFLRLSLCQPLPQPVLLAVEPQLQCFSPITS